MRLRPLLLAPALIALGCPHRSPWPWSEDDDGGSPVADAASVDAKAPPDAKGPSDAKGRPDAAPPEPCAPITFELHPYPSDRDVYGGAFAQLDDDGLLDVVVSLDSGSALARVYPGVGGGTLGAPAAYGGGGESRHLTVADLDADGATDVVVYGAIGGADDPRILWNDGAAGFLYAGRADGAYGGQTVSLDFDHDGDLDLAMTQVADDDANDGVTLFVNQGGRSLVRGATIPGASPFGLAKGDFDGDGYLDLVTTEINGQLRVIAGAGDGSLTPGVLSSFGMLSFSAPSPGDLDGDGDLDLVLSDGTTNAILVVAGNGHSTFGNLAQFVDPDAVQPIMNTVADLNGDGYLDIAWARWQPIGDVGIAQGRGGGAFCDPIYVPLEHDHAWEIDSGDIDADGRVDLLVTSGRDGPAAFTVLRNTTP